MNIDELAGMIHDNHLEVKLELTELRTEFKNHMNDHEEKRKFYFKNIWQVLFYLVATGGLVVSIITLLGS